MSLKSRAVSNNQRAREAMLQYSLHEDDIRFMLDYFEGKCAYCGAVLTNKNFWVDHVVPIIDDNEYNINFGSVAFNVVPSCSICNIAKGTKAVDTWLSARFQNAEEILIKLTEYQLRCGIDEILY